MGRLDILAKKYMRRPFVFADVLLKLIRRKSQFHLVQISQQFRSSDIGMWLKC